MSHHAPMDKKAKKKALLTKNRFQQEFFSFVRRRHLEAERVAELAEALEKPEREKEREEEEKQSEWIEKTTSIRNRLTDKKRLSNERWNRFAATADAGGRGL